MKEFVYAKNLAMLKTAYGQMEMTSGSYRDTFMKENK